MNSIVDLCSLFTLLCTEIHDRLLTGGYTQPSWCFVAEDEGQFVGRVA